MCPWSSPGTNHSLAFPFSSAAECWWCRSEVNTEPPSPFQSSVWKGGKLVTLTMLLKGPGCLGVPYRAEGGLCALWLFASCKNVQQSCSSVLGHLKCGRALEIPSRLCAAGICLFASCACGHPANVPPPKRFLPGGGQTAPQAPSADPSSFPVLY